MKNKIVLVTGGARSGKSTFAENLLKDYDNVLYIATAIVTDEEMKDRIKKHKERRNPKWKTYEGFKDLDRVLEKDHNSNVLLDCVTIMTTNLMFSEKKDFDNISDEEIQDIINNIKKEFEKLIFKAREKNINLVMVTNEVGMGLVPDYKLGRIFRDIQGIINQFVANLSNEVYFTACGLPLKLK